MKLYLLEPEVSGGHGEGTEYHSPHTGHISEKILKLDYEFYGWLGDDLLESTPAFIVTDALAHTLLTSGLDLDSIYFRDCVVSISDFFREMQPDTVLPTFKELCVRGRVETDGSVFWGWSGLPFSMTSQGALVVTAEALSFLKGFNMDNCSVKELALLEVPMLPIIRSPVNWSIIEKQIGLTINKNYRDFYETLGAINLDDYFYIVGIDPIHGLFSHIDWVQDCFEGVEFPSGHPPLLTEWLPVGNTDDIFIFCSDTSVMLADFELEEFEVYSCTLLDFVKQIVNNQTDSKLIHNDLDGIPHNLQIYEKRQF